MEIILHIWPWTKFVDQNKSNLGINLFLKPTCGTNFIFLTNHNWIWNPLVRYKLAKPTPYFDKNPSLVTSLFYASLRFLSKLSASLQICKILLIFVDHKLNKNCWCSTKLTFNLLVGTHDLQPLWSPLVSLNLVHVLVFFRNF